MPTKDYKSCIPTLINRIEECDMSEENVDILKDFHRDLQVMDYSPARIYKLLQHLKMIGEEIDFNFREATKDDIKDVVAWINQRDLANSTKRDYKVILKRFYKWIGGGEYPEYVTWINTTSKRQKSVLPESMLTEDDVLELIDAANHNRDKALISVLWETGGRVGEIIDLNVGSLEDHKHGLKVVISGKTGPRRLLLISSVPHLRSWINSHPEGDNSDAPLWVNIGNTNFGKKMKHRTILKMLRKTKEKAGIKKPVNPQKFRHSRATYLANRFTESQLCAWMGWVQGSNQAQRYVHLSGRDIDSKYANIHGIKDNNEPEKSKLAPKECPRCSETVPPDAEFCHRCGQALSLEAKKEIDVMEDDVSKDMPKILKEESEILDDMDKWNERIKLMKENEDVIEDFIKLLKENKS